MNTSTSAIGSINQPAHEHQHVTTHRLDQSTSESPSPTSGRCGRSSSASGQQSQRRQQSQRGKRRGEAWCKQQLVNRLISRRVGRPVGETRQHCRTSQSVRSIHPSISRRARASQLHTALASSRRAHTHICIFFFSLSLSLSPCSHLPCDFVCASSIVRSARVAHTLAGGLGNRDKHTERETQRD